MRYCTTSRNPKKPGIHWFPCRICRVHQDWKYHQRPQKGPSDGYQNWPVDIQPRDCGQGKATTYERVSPTSKDARVLTRRIQGAFTTTIHTSVIEPQDTSFASIHRDITALFSSHLWNNVSWKLSLVLSRISNISTDSMKLTSHIFYLTSVYVAFQCERRNIIKKRCMSCLHLIKPRYKRRLSLYVTHPKKC